MIAMARAGIDAFWASAGESAARVRVIEIVPVAVLLALCLALTVRPGPVMDYMQAAARSLHAPAGYVEGVFPPPAPPGESGQ
jgi:multicomponent K+:H+ antiporter subunit D